jgi:O-antigen/teichoic acid export membrane protein
MIIFGFDVIRRMDSLLCVRIVVTLWAAKLSANNDSASRRRETWRILVQIGLGMSALGLLAAVSAASVIAALLGPSYLPAASMFHILVAAIIVYGMNNILSNHMAAEGLPWSGDWIWVAALAVNVALNLVCSRCSLCVRYRLYQRRESLTRGGIPESPKF